MSIQYAMLGLMSFEPLTGYDLKKRIQDSPFMHWSGNNNQIYNALVGLLNDGLVSKQTLHQEGAPSKNLYTITDAGKAALKSWVTAPCEPPEFKRTFLIQLAWADQLLDAGELMSLLEGYAETLRTELLMLRERKRRGLFSPGRSPREALLWESIYDNTLGSFENELAWVEGLRVKLFGQ